MKPAIYFDTYAEVLDYIENPDNIDSFIIEAVNDFINDEKLELVELDIECKELHKILKIVYEREMIPDVLRTVLDRLLSEEKYEDAVIIRDLMNKFK